jgi:uncharacterized protein (TIGR02246 family)
MLLKTAKYATVISCMALMAGCASNPQTAAAPDTRAADEVAIRKLDAEWVKAGQAKSVDGWVSFYADDAVVLPPNEKMAASKEAIRKSIGDFLAMPGLSIHWAPVKVEVGRSGDLAYLYGAYEMTANDAKGKPISDKGKNVEIWKKQADGNWKCIVDTWNSDMPAEGPK